MQKSECGNQPEHFSEKLFQNDPVLTCILDSLNEGVILVDKDGIVIYANHAYERITGEQRPKILYRNVLESDPEARLPQVLKTKRAVRSAFREINGFQFVSDMSPIFRGNNLLGAIAIVHDCNELLEKNRIILDKRTPIEDKTSLSKDFNARYTFDDIVGDCEALHAVKAIARKISNSSIPVLITGESGTGKELFAHGIHNYSSRRQKPFVAINCSAFEPTLLMSELFGYARGAFTGANKEGKPGLFEIANHGTIFLDEIGEMEYELQAKLLRVLETGEFLRIGGTKHIRSDVRLISATNQNLSVLVRQKRFRSDLWFRLNAASVAIPPLRERGSGDVLRLIYHYLDRLNKSLNKHCTLSDEAMLLLVNYSFPGNVRELINILQYSVLCSDTVIGPEDIRIRTPEEYPLFTPDKPQYPPRLRSSEQDAEQLLGLLKEYGWSVKGKRQAAAALGISLATLYNRLREYGIAGR